MPGLEGVETVLEVPGGHRHGQARLLAVVLVPAFGEAGPHRQAVVQRRHHASVAGLQNARVVPGLSIGGRHAPAGQWRRLVREPIAADRPCRRATAGCMPCRTQHWPRPNPPSPARTLQELPCKAHFPSFAGLDGQLAAQRWRGHCAAPPEQANQTDGPVSGGRPVGRDCAYLIQPARRGTGPAGAAGETGRR